MLQVFLTQWKPILVGFNVLNPTLELDDGFDIHGLMMHMHRLGRSGEVVLVKSDGTEYHC